MVAGYRISSVMHQVSVVDEGCRCPHQIIPSSRTNERSNLSYIYAPAAPDDNQENKTVEEKKLRPSDEKLGTRTTYKHEPHDDVIGELDGQAGLFLQTEQDRYEALV